MASIIAFIRCVVKIKAIISGQLKGISFNYKNNFERNVIMKKIAAILLSLVLALAVAGCSDSSNTGNGGSGNGSTVNGGTTNDNGNNANQTTADSIYKTFKDVYRSCSDDINTGISQLSSYYDDAYYQTPAAQYQSYMNYGKSIFAGCEDIFSGDDSDIKSGAEDSLHLSDVEYSINGGTAVIKGKNTDNQDTEITVEYDGSSSAQIIGKANGEQYFSASFTKNGNYSVVSYSDSFITAINATCTNGDVYYIYDTNGLSGAVSVYNNEISSFADLASGKAYIAIEGGNFVNGTV